MGARGPPLTVTAQSRDLCPVTALCSQINSNRAEKKGYDPDCCFACELRKLGVGVRVGMGEADTKGIHPTIKKILSHSHVQGMVTGGNLDHPF